MENYERMSILKEIFDDKVIKIINLFLENPNKNFTLTDVVDESGISLATAHRRLNYLLSRNIILANKKKNSKKINSYVLERGDKTIELSRIFFNPRLFENSNNINSYLKAIR